MDVSHSVWYQISVELGSGILYKHLLLPLYDNVKVQYGVYSVKGTDCECTVWLVTLGLPLVVE